MKCTLLPSEKVVLLEGELDTAADIAVELSTLLHITSNGIHLFERDSSNRLVECSKILEGDHVYALIRCRGGGKGGFKKQLEKKGREYAQAKLKAKRKSRESQKQKKKPKTENKEAVPPRKVEAVSNTDGKTARVLGKQGAHILIEKIMNSLSAAPTQ